ncbi:MAG: hypothetical protein HYW78_04190, partial [Parcubacteria group bacterium]|nr:hypothetical protein [Parcubacteria group bacterium]
MIYELSKTPLVVIKAVEKELKKYFHGEIEILSIDFRTTDRKNDTQKISNGQVRFVIDDINLKERAFTGSVQQEIDGFKNKWLVTIELNISEEERRYIEY